MSLLLFPLFDKNFYLAFRAGLSSRLWGLHIPHECVGILSSTDRFRVVTVAQIDSRLTRGYPRVKRCWNRKVVLWTFLLLLTIANKCYKEVVGVHGASMRKEVSKHEPYSLRSLR